MSTPLDSRLPLSDPPSARRRATTLVAVTALVLGVLAPLTFAAPAQAAPSDFTNSFESADGAPLSGTVEQRDGITLQQNVRGVAATIAPTTVTANSENGAGEAAVRASDGDPNTKWLTRTTTGWLQYQLASSQRAGSYELTSANDDPPRDPKSWRLEGSADGTTWTTLDTRTDQTWSSARLAKKSFSITTPGSYTYYRLTITANNGSGEMIQLADFDLKSEAGVALPVNVEVGSGPATGYNMKARVGWTGVRSLHYYGEHTAEGRASTTQRLFDVDILVGPTSRLSYKIFPEFTGNDMAYPSTFTAVDLKFTDGSFLSDLAPRDWYDIPATANGQGVSDVLYPNQWNSVKIDLGRVAEGKTVSGILFAYDNSEGAAATKFGGWIDDIQVEATPATIDGSSLTNYVDTRRGTNSGDAFSRGSNEAITATPNGFNFLIPVTNATAQSREYSYQRNNNNDNLPTFQGLGISHQPSPWMGDRSQFSLMPVAGGGGATAGNAGGRAQAFSHANETAQPDYYSVALNNGVRAEGTATSHGTIMRFTFASGNTNSVVLDGVNDNGSFTIAADGSFTGYISQTNNGGGRMFVYGTFDRAPSASGNATGGRSLTRYAAFDTSSDKTVTARIATSFISVDQAKHNLDLEVGSKSFTDVRNEAKALWNDRLDVIAVEGASETEKVTLYGNLYRLSVYPNEQHENVGTAEAPEYEYASPVNAKTGADTATTTGSALKAGKMYVNNGFWDTYRTVWSAYALLYPEFAGELVDGFTEQYRAGGWISRWSSPGYANIMTGTSSDVSFADAYLRGAPLPHALDTYDAAVKNATVPSADESVGRKSLNTSMYLGYTPASQGESVSWAVEGYINDFGIGKMAAALAEDPATPEARREQLRADSAYYLDRATNYVHIFDPAVDFLQARNANGTFAVSPENYNPKNWWGPYTETNGWNYAFSAPQDPQGVANLYGGRQGLEDKLDEFFATPETTTAGIHEMAEARDGRFGQWGVSNQVSHHIPFMYNAAGAPAKAQQIVREALQRSFAGSDIGQGYPGDEDNGEMSAWYIFSALGLYPLQVGSSELVVGSPLFDKATVALAGGDLVINADNNSSENVYVQSLTVNGEAYDSTSIDSNDLINGATLDFSMGAEPSAWGTAADSAPPSLTEGDAVPNPLVDATDASIAKTTTADGQNVAALVDNTSSTAVTFATGTPSVTVAYTGAKQRPTFYTVTSGATPGTDPSAWTLEGSDDGVTWTSVDERSDQAFSDRRQLRPFKIENPGSYSQFRLTVTAGAQTISLSELELLTNGEGSEANELTLSVTEGLATTSGVETPFALGVLSGGAGDYTVDVDWGDGSDASAGNVGDPRLGNYPVSASHTYAQAGVYRAAVTITAGESTRTVPVAITVSYIEPGSLVDAFDNVCIGDEGVGGANCDYKGFGYPRAGLTAGGLTPGVLQAVPGTDLKFAVPVIAVGQPDNATGDGQTINVNLGTGAEQLSFIGSGTERNQDTTAVVNFTDGTTATVPLQFSDWTKGGNAANVAPFGNIEVVKSPNRLNGGGTQGTAAYFFSTVPYTIPAGRTVKSITLPDQPGDAGAVGRVHIFAIASDGVVPNQAFQATVGEGISTEAGEEVEATLATISLPHAAATQPIARVQWGDATVTEDATVTVDSEGVLKVTGSHTWEAAGTYPVSVTVANGSGTTQLSLTATVAPATVYQTAIEVTPSEGVLPGEDFTVTGDGFAPNELVTIVVATPTELEREVTASAEGTVSTTFTIAESVPADEYSVVASGPKSKIPASAMILVLPPVVVPQVDVTAEVIVRCSGGKAVLAVQALNNEDGKVDLVFASQYGSKSVNNLGADKRSTHSFTTRLVTLPAGIVSVTATLDDGSATSEVNVPYEAKNCG